MKAIFINDHRFLEDIDSGVFYSTGTLNNEFWLRYLKFFDHITVVGRGERLKLSKSENLISSTPNVTFKLLFDVKGGTDYILKRKQIKKHLNDVLQHADFAIIRVPSSLGNYAAEICVKLNIPYIVEVVGCIKDVSHVYGNFFVKLSSRFLFKRMQNVVKNATGAIYVTKHFLQNRYPCLGETTSASNVRISAGNKSVLEERLIKIENMVSPAKIGMIGGFNLSYKGHAVLLESAAYLKENGYDFRLYFVGGGSSNDIERLIAKYDLKDNVEIVGRLPGGQPVLDFIDHLDLLVHPSLTEGLPRAVIEAMSRACPVLVSDVGGLPELVAGDCVHKSGDAAQLSNQIKASITNKNLLKESAQRNFITASEFDIKYLEEKRTVFLQNIVNKISR